MTQPTVQCPYCGNSIPIMATQRGSSDKFSMKIYVREWTSSMAGPSYNVECTLCERKYGFVELADFSWIKANLELSDVVLKSFKSIFSEEKWGNLDVIFKNITGIAKPKRRYLHICFKINELRVYLECFRRGNTLRAIGLYRC